jgi:ABC-type branched-chain amino acid transport systems, ATPase component
VVVNVTLLQAQNVRKLYGGFCALDDVTLTINDGEHVSIIGPNGAGKTTLVNVLTGLVRPTAGNVMFKGYNVVNLGAVRLARLGMARSFQLVNIFPELSVGETIAVAAISHLRHGERFFSSTARNRPVWEIVERVGAIFGFSGKLDQPAKILSQGDKKLLDVASAFALSPEIILLDEPTSGVSTADKSTIMRVLVQAARQMGIKAIIQIEHDMDIVFGYSNRIIAVHNGRILADGSPASIRARADVMATIVGRQYGDA